MAIPTKTANLQNLQPVNVITPDTSQVWESIAARANKALDENTAKIAYNEGVKRQLEAGTSEALELQQTGMFGQDTIAARAYNEATQKTFSYQKRNEIDDDLYNLHAQYADKKDVQGFVTAYEKKKAQYLKGVPIELAGEMNAYVDAQGSRYRQNIDGLVRKEKFEVGVAQVLDRADRLGSRITSSYLAGDQTDYNMALAEMGTILNDSTVPLDERQRLAITANLRKTLNYAEAQRHYNGLDAAGKKSFIDSLRSASWKPSAKAFGSTVLWGRDERLDVFDSKSIANDLQSQLNADERDANAATRTLAQKLKDDVELIGKGLPPSKDYATNRAAALNDPTLKEIVTTTEKIGIEMRDFTNSPRVEQIGRLKDLKERYNKQELSGPEIQMYEHMSKVFNSTEAAYAQDPLGTFALRNEITLEPVIALTANESSKILERRAQVEAASEQTGYPIGFYTKDEKDAQKKLLKDPSLAPEQYLQIVEGMGIAIDDPKKLRKHMDEVEVDPAVQAQIFAKMNDPDNYNRALADRIAIGTRRLADNKGSYFSDSNDKVKENILSNIGNYFQLNGDQTINGIGSDATGSFNKNLADQVMASLAARFNAGSDTLSNDDIREAINNIIGTDDYTDLPEQDVGIVQLPFRRNMTAVQTETIRDEIINNGLFARATGTDIQAGEEIIDWDYVRDNGALVPAAPGKFTVWVPNPSTGKLQIAKNDEGKPVIFDYGQIRTEVELKLNEPEQMEEIPSQTFGTTIGDEDISGSMGGDDLSNTISNAANQFGVDHRSMHVIAAIESNFNPSAQNSQSSAGGLYQFTDDTWRSMVRKYGTQTGIGYMDKMNPQANAIMAAAYTRENADYIRKMDIEPNTVNLYLAHFLGKGGFSRMLNANVDAPAESIFPKAAKVNRNIFYSNGRPLSIQEMYDLIASKVERAGARYT